MLPVTKAEQTLITELTEFCENALTALERISDGFELAIKVLDNQNIEDQNNDIFLRISNALSNVKELVSNFKISQDSDTLWISCKVNLQHLYYRDAADTPINAKNLMFALMSFESAFVENINIIHDISGTCISTLYYMKTALHTHITNYVEAT
ncbi:MAG: hypothetical protein IJ272_03405 [Clostridia bacterium]|nr:hypothetical protein [Clostridia bacterium]